MLENQLYSSSLYRRWTTGSKEYAFNSNDDDDVNVSHVIVPTKLINTFV